MSKGRQERTVDVAAYHARGAAQVDRYWTEGCGKEVLERDQAFAQAMRQVTGASGVTVRETRDGERFVLEVTDRGTVRVVDVAVTPERIVRSHVGPDALQDATRYAGQLNRGEVQRPTRVTEHDVVTIHTGTKRYEVIRVELDSMVSGERLDFALLEPIDDDRAPFWQACDLLHVQETRSGMTGSLQIPDVRVFKR